MSRTNDDKRTRAACSGDAQAFGELVSAHHRTVAGVAYAITGSHSAVDDLVQDTFLVAWKNLEELRVPGQFTAWLNTIARNLSKNWIRSEVYRRALKKAYSSEAATDSPARADDNIQQTERYEPLFQILDGVTPPLREVLVLFYLEEMSVKEISAVLNISASNARKRLERGRTQMRRATENELKSKVASDTQGNELVKQNVLARLAVGPALPLAEYATTGSIAAIPTSTTLASSQPFLQTITKGIITMSTKKLAVSAGMLLLVTIGLSTLYLNPERERKNGIGQGTSPETQSLTAPQGGELSKSTPSATAKPLASNPDSNAEAPMHGLVEALPQAEILDQARDEEHDEVSEFISTVSGIVYDEWGEPVEDANVLVAFTEITNSRTPVGIDMAQNIGISDPSNQFRGKTNRDGKYEISGTFENSIGYLVASRDGAKGHERIHVETGQLDSSFDITIKGGVSLFGKILSASNEPVAGAYVASVSFFPDSGGARGGRLDVATADDEGIFELVYKEAGNSSVHVISTEGQAVFRDVPVGEPGTVPLQLPETGALYGQISYSDGSPAEGVWIVMDSTHEASVGHNSMMVGLNGVYGTQTDEEGEYEIVNIAPDSSYSVTVTEANPEALDVPQLSPKTGLGMIGPGARLEWNYTVQGHSTISGVVRGEPSGDPVGGVSIHLNNWESVTTTDVDGRYRMELTAEPGEYEIWPMYRHTRWDFAKEQYSESIQLDYGEETERSFSIPDPCTVRLTVLDPDGTPIENAEISPTFTTGSYNSSFAMIGKTDDQGSFEWSMMPPMGTMQFTARTEGYISGKSKKYQGEPGMVYPEEVIVVYEKAGIEGYAVDSNGEPLEFGLVYLKARVDGERIFSHRVKTVEEGYFILDDALPATVVGIKMAILDDAGDVVESWKNESINLESGMLTSLGTVQMVLGDNSD